MCPSDLAITGLSLWCIAMELLILLKTFILLLCMSAKENDRDQIINNYQQLRRHAETILLNLFLKRSKCWYLQFQETFFFLTEEHQLSGSSYWLRNWEQENSTTSGFSAINEPVCFSWAFCPNSQLLPLPCSQCYCLLYDLTLLVLLVREKRGMSSDCPQNVSLTNTKASYSNSSRSTFI